MQGLKPGAHYLGLPWVQKGKWYILGFVPSGSGVREVFGYFSGNILCLHGIYFSKNLEEATEASWLRQHGGLDSKPSSCGISGPDSEGPPDVWSDGGYLRPRPAAGSEPGPSYRHLSTLQHVPFWLKPDSTRLSSLQVKPDQNTASARKDINQSATFQFWFSLAAWSGSRHTLMFTGLGSLNWRWKLDEARVP